VNKYYKTIAFIIVFIIVSFWVFINLNKPGKFIRKKPLVAPQEKARVSIVLDDWGYNQTDLPLLFQIKSPITIAVLPNLQFSKQVAQSASAHGYQVILHLPLESKSNKSPEKDTLYSNMDNRTLTQSLRQILNSSPGISGVNNHQGSKATEDPRMMRIVLSELKRRKLFFLDSLTTDNSVCAQAAKNAGIKYAQRDIFLDLPSLKLTEQQLRSYIQAQLYKLSQIAVKNGFAIGIGHDRKTTLRVLNDVLPRLEKKGIKLVFVSELEK
jgi:polysaccharide deacetylase 2 family uncharacterized protein YibQ